MANRVGPMDGLVVCVAECCGWEGALTYGAEGAVTCCGSMVSSAVGAGEFSGGGAWLYWGLAHGADVGGRGSVARLGVVLPVLVRVAAVVVIRRWVVLWVELVVVEGATAGGALFVVLAVQVTAGLLVGLVVV